MQYLVCDSHWWTGHLDHATDRTVEALSGCFVVFVPQPSYLPMNQAFAIGGGSGDDGNCTIFILILFQNSIHAT